MYLCTQCYPAGGARPKTYFPCARCGANGPTHNIHDSDLSRVRHGLAPRIPDEATFCATWRGLAAESLDDAQGRLGDHGWDAPQVPTIDYPEPFTRRQLCALLLLHGAVQDAAWDPASRYAADTTDPGVETPAEADA